MNDSLERLQVILLTGASVGLGLAIARILREEPDTHLILTARRSSLDRFSEVGIMASDRVWIRELDVTSASQREAIVSEAEDKLGGIDVLINNAGITYRTTAEYATELELSHQMAVNYEGPMALCQLVLPGMRRRRSGRIIQISSAGGLVSMPTMGLYSASKFALEAASEAMHYEVRPFGIRVSLILPGFIHSKSYLQSIVGKKTLAATEDVDDPYHPHFTNMNRFIERWMRIARASPESVARKVVKTMGRSRPSLRVLASVDARFLWWFRRFSPHVFNIWLTYRLLPGRKRWSGLKRLR